MEGHDVTETMGTTPKQTVLQKRIVRISQYIVAPCVAKDMQKTPAVLFIYQFKWNKKKKYLD